MESLNTIFHFNFIYCLLKRETLFGSKWKYVNPYFVDRLLKYIYEWIWSLDYHLPTSLFQFSRPTYFRIMLISSFWLYLFLRIFMCTKENFSNITYRILQTHCTVSSIQNEKLQFFGYAFFVSFSRANLKIEILSFL